MNNKIVKLNESDLIRLITKVINEQYEDIFSEYMSEIEDVYRSFDHQVTEDELDEMMEHIDNVLREASYDENITVDELEELHDVADEVVSEMMRDFDNKMDMIDEGPLDTINDLYRGVKGVRRGYAMDYFQNISRLDRLIKKLKKLDEPNVAVMNELTNLKTKVAGLNMSQQRKQVIVDLINNSVFHFNQYNLKNDQIINQIKTLNIDSWK